MAQPNTPLPRISMRSIYESILAVFNFEKGLSFTIKNLLLRPGITLRNYLYSTERLKHIKPINFLFLMVTIATFLTLQFIKSTNPEILNGTQINDPMNGSSINLENLLSDKGNDAFVIFNKMMNRYYHIFQLLKVPFFALATFWIFGKRKYNYAEHLVMNAYIIGLITFLFIIAFPAMLINMKMFAVLILLSTIYMFVVYMLVYNEKSFKGLLKAIASYLLASILHFLFIGILVFLIYIAMD